MPKLKIADGTCTRARRLPIHVLPLLEFQQFWLVSVSRSVCYTILQIVCQTKLGVAETPNLLKDMGLCF